MKYLVTLTFDLKDASPKARQIAYKNLGLAGFDTALTSDSGEQVDLTTTTTWAGEFTGLSREGVRDILTKRVAAVFENERISAEIFLTVGENVAWAFCKTQPSPQSATRTALVALARAGLLSRTSGPVSHRIPRWQPAPGPERLAVLMARLKSSRANR